MGSLTYVGCVCLLHIHIPTQIFKKSLRPTYSSEYGMYTPPTHIPHHKQHIYKGIFQWIRLVNQDLVFVPHTSWVCCISVVLVLKFLQPLRVHNMNGYLCACCVPHACLVPEEGVGSLELELRSVVSSHVGTGSWTWAHCKSSSCFSFWIQSHLSCPSPTLYFEAETPLYLEFIVSRRLACYQVLECALPCPRHWNYKSSPPCCDLT